MTIKKYLTLTAYLTCCFSAIALSQDTSLNKYGLWVISKAADLERTTHNDPGKKMKDIRSVKAIILDLRYAGKNNFMHQRLYPAIKTTYLRQNAIQALILVQQELQKKNMAIKVWDAYRPYSVTKKMWEPVKDDRYAADPKFGSGHNRGIAIDLSIVDLSTNKELDMGTGFDNFTDSAHHDFKNLPAKVLQNRQLLRSIMEQFGFKALETEWWHYYLPDTKKYELLDISFKELGKLL